MKFVLPNRKNNVVFLMSSFLSIDKGVQFAWFYRYRTDRLIGNYGFSRVVKE